MVPHLITRIAKSTSVTWGFGLETFSIVASVTPKNHVLVYLPAYPENPALHMTCRGIELSMVRLSTHATGEGDCYQPRRSEDRVQRRPVLRG